MIDISPFSTYLDLSQGASLPLPESIAKIYGRLALPLRRDHPYVISNFVSTLDGVVALNIKGHAGGGDISGFNHHDQLLMAVLRAASDAVIVGTSQLRQPPGAIWIPETIYPKAKAELREFRAALGKDEAPLQVVLTARGDLDLGLPIFQERLAPVAILTNQAGAKQLETQSPPAWVQIVTLENTGRLTAHEVLRTVQRIRPGQLYLIEGGPHLVRYFFEENLLDELFLTLAPQVAGRDPTVDRPGFVAGTMFAPFHSIWGQLVGIKSAGDHLFLRYRFEQVNDEEGKQHGGK